jgi:hypothetical protein
MSSEGEAPADAYLIAGFKSSTRAPRIHPALSAGALAAPANCSVALIKPTIASS